MWENSYGAKPTENNNNNQYLRCIQVDVLIVHWLLFSFFYVQLIVIFICKCKCEWLCVYCAHHFRNSSELVKIGWWHVAMWPWSMRCEPNDVLHAILHGVSSFNWCVDWCLSLGNRLFVSQSRGLISFMGITIQQVSFLFPCFS